MLDKPGQSILRTARLGVITSMIMAGSCSREIERPQLKVAAMSGQYEASQTQPPTTTPADSNTLPEATPSQEASHSIDSQTDTRKFAYVMFQYQRLLACDQRSVQQSVPLTDAELRALNESIREANAAWKTVQNRAVPPEEFFDRFLPRAKKFEALVKETVSTGKRKALLPTIIKEHRGAMVFLLPEIPEAIGLTDDQLVEAEKMVDETARQFDWSKMSLLQVPKLLRLSAANRKQVEAKMSESQLAQWKALRGD